MLYTRSLSQDVIFKCYFADVSFAEFFVFFYSSGLEILFVNLVGGNTQFHVCQRRGSPDTLLPFGLIFPSSQVLGATGHPKDVQDYLPEVGGVPAEWGWPRKANSFGSRASGMPILSYLLGGRPPQLRPGWLPFLVFHWGARILGLCTHDMPGGIPSLDDTDSCSAEGGDPDSAVVSQYLPLPLFFPLKKKR